MKLRILFAVLTLFFTTPLLSQDLPKGLTDSEKQILKNYSFPSSPAGINAPPSKPVRTMAEWEELEGIMITWTSYQAILAQIVDYAQEQGKVFIVCSDSNTVKTYLTQRSIELKNLVFLIKPFNSIWSRDYGPWNVYTYGYDSLYIIDWKYNRPRPNDDLLPSHFASYYNTPLFQMTTSPEDLVATGGNFMTDGLGTGFSSKLILEENPAKTSAEIDTLMRRFMGINRYIKMDVLPYDGIHHIDMHMKLLDEETLLVGQYPPGVSDGPQIEANLQYVLSNFLTPYGRPYKVVRIPMPPDANNQYPSQGGDYRTYTNSTFVNKTVLVPTYELRYDTTALRIYREALPGYNIIGINCNQIIPASGAIHCINKEIGVKEPLFINIPPPVNVHTNLFRVKSVVKTRSGAALVKLFWSVDTLAGYNQANMAPASDDTFSVDIFLPESATKLFYYVEATSNSGKVIRKPMTSPAGALQMNVQITVPVELSLFEGYYQNGKNILYWITSSEKNNRGFEIERNDLREDGAYGSWISVGYVQGAGTSAEINRYNFSDDKITVANYIYRLKQIDYDGTVSYSKRVNIQSELPYDFTLEQNYPNPFSTTTIIKFTIPTLGLGGTDEGLGGSAQGSGTIGTSGDVPVTLKLYDLLGREVATLVNETKSPGAYEVTLDLSGSLSGEISSGMYFYRLESGNNTITRKMIVIK